MIKYTFFSIYLFYVLTSISSAMGVIIQSHYIQTSHKVNSQAIQAHTWPVHERQYFSCCLIARTLRRLISKRFTFLTFSFCLLTQRALLTALTNTHHDRDAKVSTFVLFWYNLNIKSTKVLPWLILGIFSKIWVGNVVNWYIELIRHQTVGVKRC